MMTPRSSRTAGKRWLIWLPLLGVAFWLAVFGNRTTESTPAAQTAHSNVVSASVVPMGSSDRKGNHAISRTVKQAGNDGQMARNVVKSQLIYSLIPRAALIRVSNQHRHQTDLFAQRSWQTVSPVSAPASTEPVLPPLPFTYTGKKMEDGQWEVYLVRADEVFIVHEGGPLTADYRVEKLAPPTLSLRYLPMDQLQTLSIGDPD